MAFACHLGFSSLCAASLRGPVVTVARQCLAQARMFAPASSEASEALVPVRGDRAEASLMGSPAVALSAAADARGGVQPDPCDGAQTQQQLPEQPPKQNNKRATVKACPICNEDRPSSDFSAKKPYCK
eukprot:8597872-Alexandrium_andersonii.AAC.1